jgi:hypothetical protein
MKKLGQKSLSSVLAAAINVLWWLEWFIGAAGAVTGVITALVRRGFAIQLPVSFSAVSIKQIYAVNHTAGFSVLNTTSGKLSIYIKASFQNTAGILIVYGLILTVALIITFQLKEIFISFKRNEPFQMLNLKRIRKIALTLILASVVQWLFVIIVNQYLNTNFFLGNLKPTYDYNWSCFLIGIILIVVEGIFKIGLELEEEKQLTI